MTFPSPALECRNLAGEITHVSVVAASPGAGIEPGQQRGPHLGPSQSDAAAWWGSRLLDGVEGASEAQRESCPEREGCQMRSLHIHSCSWYTCLLPVPAQTAGEGLSRG